MRETTQALVILILLLSCFSHASSNSCSQFYGPLRFKEKAKVYWSEIKKNPLRRPFLVPEKSADLAPNEKLNGFLTPSEALGFSIFRPIVQYPIRSFTRKKYGEAYDVTPMHYLYKNYVHPAVTATTWHLSLNGPYQLTKLSKFIGVLTLSISSFMVYDHITSAKINQHTRQEIQAALPEYRKLVETDFRFQELRAYKDKTSLTLDEAMMFSAHIRSLQREYFQYMAERYFSEYTQDRQKTHLDALANKSWGAVQFRDIAALYRNGIPENSPNFLYSKEFTTKISEAQLDRLMKNRHFALHKFEYIHSIFESAKDKNDILNHPEIGNYFDTPQSKAFLEHALEQWKNDQDKKGLIRKLNVFTHWEERFSNYSALGLTLIEPGSQGPTLVTPEKTFSKILSSDAFVNQYYIL